VTTRAARGLRATGKAKRRRKDHQEEEGWEGG